MAKKRRGPGRPKTTGKGTLIGARVHKPFLSRLDKWRDDQPSEVSRPAALLSLADKALSDSGY